MATRGKNFDSISHRSESDGSIFKMTDSDGGSTVCANKTENHHSNDKSWKESSEFLVKYRNRIYDISNFLNYHPGGKNTLSRLKDQVLDGELAKNPHSKSAYYLLEEFAVKQQERYNECENLIDWNAPILWQVGFMGDRYWEWVNLPVNRPIRYFESEILEMLSITPWYILPIVWLPIATYFLYMGCVSKISTNIAITAQNILPSIVLGLFIWTVVEYFVHRKVFHFEPPHNSKVLITLHFLFHGSHHKAPLDERRLVFPPTFSLFVALIVWNLYKLIFPQAIVHLVAAGTMIGYLSYDLIHYYLHNGAPTAGSYLYTMKRRHNYHHFVHHDQGFGVTSELWDRLLKTDLILRKLNEPLKW
ncbi:dihydroceramide fatty acyl 2-hydroxylase FAH1 [Solenopsis invicta]|uniref:dihydroceramide fatty acyl 2-hydroxylase FAH1 n=1 Tax=Solenopsis invicta TaxID=13686 RepID=UPI000E33F218|nr:dihydroceramide fatty acyl 2-hydroxylase FAH1 [Solenopsis invicta]